MSQNWSSVLVVLALMLTPLGGCIGLVSPGSSQCQAVPLTTAQWEDPEAVAEIRALEEAEPYTPSSAFQVDEHPWNRSPGDANYVIDVVKWDVGSRVPGSTAEGMSTFVLRDDGKIVVQLPLHVPDREVRELFEEFVETVTEADQEAISDWAEAFVASREDHPGPGEGSSGFSLQVDAAIELDHLVRDLADENPRSLGLPGVAIVADGNWALKLSFPYQRIDNGRPSDGFWTLSADALDQVVVELPNAGEDPEAVADRVGQVYIDLGIDAAPPDPGSLETSTVCAPEQLKHGEPS